MPNTVYPQTLSNMRAFARRPHQMYIGGEWRSAQTGDLIDTFNPSNGERLGAAPAGVKRDVDAAVAAARKCFEEDWSKRPAPERERLLLKFASLLDKHRDELAVLETLDNGTLLSHMTGSVVDFWINTVTYFAGWPTKTSGLTLPSPHQHIPAGGEGFSFTLREPVGVVGAILPWNAPASFLINKAVPALAAGCTLVAKPAEQTPLTALYLAQLFEEAGFPPGAVNIVTGYGHEVGAALAQHPDVNKVSFTGSTSVGKQIARDGAESLKHLTLELGGKSSFVVMADADLDAAAQAAAYIGFFQAGQFCMCPSRILVEKSVVDAFVEKLTRLASSVIVGDAADMATTMGPIISGAQLENVETLIASAREEGADLIIGGNTRSDEGYFAEPTLFFKPDTNLTIARKEIFGPVLLISCFDQGSDLDKIAALANETSYGLAASVWTRDLSIGHRMITRFRAGLVGVNSHAAIQPMAPFGGVKDSGVGREFGFEGYDSFFETKTVSMIY